MDQTRTPLYSALMKHYEQLPISFHVPGHKYGEIFPSFSLPAFSNILKLDVTELDGLDDLHSPSGVIKEGQDLVADLYGVSDSYFLVGGSTAGNLAMILATCNQGDYVLVQRNCHKSIIHGLQLAGVIPVFLSPIIDNKSGIPLGISKEIIQKAFAHYSKASALILTYPNYYGMSSNELKAVIEFAHSHNVPVLVDEAHGAHFCLNHYFPKSSIDYGADIVVQSAHKTLPAMTMGSYLHFKSSLIDKQQLEYYLQTVQTSSPSYPIMASLDLARHYLANIEEIDLTRTYKNINWFRDALDKIPQLKVLPSSTQEYKNDLLKVTIQTQCALTGFEIQSLLLKNNIYTELADPNHVLFVLPLIMNEKLEEVVKVIANVMSDFDYKENAIYIPEANNEITTLDTSYRRMKNKATTYSPLSEAIGKISACNIVPYPPGIPVIMIGEKITSQKVKLLIDLKEKGASLQREHELWSKGIKVFLKS